MRQEKRGFLGVTNSLGPDRPRLQLSTGFCPLSSPLGPCQHSPISDLDPFRVEEAKGSCLQKPETMEFDKTAFVDILRKLIGENR